MLEGKEYETKFGDYGHASVDVTSDLKVKVDLGVEVDLIQELKKLALKTDTQVDDQAIAWIEGMIKVLNAGK